MNLLFVCISLQVFPQTLMPSLDTWETSKVPLCAFIVKQDGAIEDAGSDVVQVKFLCAFCSSESLHTILSVGDIYV